MEFEKYLESLNDDDLIKAFEDFQKVRDVGVLSDGKAREIWKVWDEIYKDHASLTFIESEVYHELARRYYILKTK